MKKSGLITLSSCLIAIMIMVFACRRKGDDRPNLLLITLDTTRADHLGCYGYSGAVTPALDFLAESGVKFNRAFCNVPLTLPSHATMMTGLYPPEHGCRVNGAHALGEELTTLAEVFASRGYQTAAFVAAFVLDRKFGLNRGFGTYDDYEVPTSNDIYDDNVMYRYRRGDKVTDAALSWLIKHSRKPFFCWVHFFDPHRPYYFNRPNPSDAYDREISFMDSQIKRLIDYLKEEDLLEKTIIIAVGDHGEGLGEHGEDEHGLLLYNPVMRVPLLLSWPGRRGPGEEVTELVSTVDLFPTILDLFVWELPGRTSGRSFARALKGDAVPERPVYLETEFPLTEYGWSPLRGLVTGKWKYVMAPREELYDLKSDPEETDNLAESRTETVNRLKTHLETLEKNMAKKESTEVKLDELSRRTLESLGYLGGGGSRREKDVSLRDPKDAIWMRSEFIRAVEDYQKGNITEAESKLKNLIGESPESYTFRYKLAKIFYDQGRFQEALGQFKEMTRMDPEEYRTHYNLGKTLIKLGRFEEAIKELKTALEFDPEQTAGHNNLGIALLKSGEVREAMKAFQKSLSIDDNQVDPHNNLGNALLSLGRTKEAMKEFRRSVEVDPDFFEGHYNLGLTLFNLGRYRQAAQQFQKVLVLRPGFTEAQKKLSSALNRR